MIIYNVTSIDNLTVTTTNTTGNSTIPWYINGEGAMAFSIAVILVFGMSIIFFIMLSINKTRTDREEEKQIWSYLKTFRQVQSNALKDDEQRIRAKLLFMSILGEQGTETHLPHKSNGKVSKIKERRSKSISGCLRVDPYDSDAWQRQLSRETITEALDQELVTIRSSFENLFMGNGRSEKEPITSRETDDLPKRNQITKIDCYANDLPEAMSDAHRVPLGSENAQNQNISTSRRSGSVPNAKVTAPLTHLPQVASLKLIESVKDDALEANKELSKNELEIIRARRRKRSGYMPPKLELLDITRPTDPRSCPMQDIINVDNEADPFEGTSTPTTPVNFVIGDEQILKPPHVGHYQKSTHATKGHRISGETPKPKLTRRAQSFRFHDRKRSVRRKNSLELPGSLPQSYEKFAFQDNQFARSLNCRRHDRQGRISVICLPHNSDSDSSNDIILPAITLPPEKLEQTISTEDTEQSDLVQDVMEEISRRSSVVSSHNGSVTDFVQNNRISNDDSKSSHPEDVAHLCMVSKENESMENQTSEELVPLVSSQEVPLDPESEPNPLTLKRSSRNRRSGVINVQYRR